MNTETKCPKCESANVENLYARQRGHYAIQELLSIIIILFFAVMVIVWTGDFTGPDRSADDDVYSAAQAAKDDQTQTIYILVVLAALSIIAAVLWTIRRRARKTSICLRCGNKFDHRSLS